MYSRAYILLQREFQELKENNYEGITAFPVSEDMMQWEVDIEGLQNTIWHGSFFQLRINFTSGYNFVPPVVRFRTIPFHPNVDPHTGQPCVDFLDHPRKWNRSYTLSSILLTLQVMLSNPVLENPVNLEAAHILIKDETLYRLIILRLFHQPLQFWTIKYTVRWVNGSFLEANATVVAASLMVKSMQVPAGQTRGRISNNSSRLRMGKATLAGGKLPITKAKDDSTESPKEPDKLNKSIKSVSFHDYYKTWSGIATSKATEYYRTPLLEDPGFVGEYYKWKKDELKRPKEWGLKYAAAMARITRENKKPHKTNYPTERRCICTTPIQTFSDSQTETDIVTKTDETKKRWKRIVLPGDVTTNEPWEEEVEDLVSWTNTLDTDALED